MRWSFRIGRIAGIRIELHVTFLLFIAWIAIQRGVLTGSVTQALGSALLMLLVFGCVLLHELGHALTARRFGIVTRDIILLPIGGVARLERMPREPRQELIVALAGPAVNVAIAAVLFLWLRLSGGMPPFLDATSLSTGFLDRTFAARLLAVNLWLVLFN